MKMMAFLRAIILLCLFNISKCLTLSGGKPPFDVELTEKRATLSGTRFVIHPSPRRLEDVRNEHIDTSGMIETYLTVPGTTENVTIFVYDPSDDLYVSGSVIKTHSWEGAAVKQILDLWQAGSQGNFLDVGANIGTFTLPISHQLTRYGSQAVIIEAMPDIAAHLKAGIEANQLHNVALYQYAVGSPDSENSLKIAENPLNKGGSSVVGNVPWTAASDAQVVEVGLTTIDAVLDSNPALEKLLVMKMDIEGNEGRALKGATRLLAEFPPCYLMIELFPDYLESAGTPCPSIKQQLDDAGYDTSGPFCEWNTYWFPQRDMEKCLARNA